MNRKLFFCIFIITFISLLNYAGAENSFTKALRTCDKYSQIGGASYQGEHYSILITLEKNKKGCTYKEKISKSGGYQLLTCNFSNEHLNTIADSMDKFTTAYKSEIDKNRIYEAKLTANAEVFENYIINPKYCAVSKSKGK